MTYKKILSVLLALILSAIGISVYADVDESKVVVSYTEYEEIKDYEEILQIAQAQSVATAALPAVATPQTNRIRVRQIDENQIQADQLLSQTVYADGSVEENRLNSLLVNYPDVTIISQQGGSSTLTATSKIYYYFVDSDEEDITGLQSGHYIDKGSTTINYNMESTTVSLFQELYVMNMGMYIDDNIRYATHSNVTTNVEKFIDYDESIRYTLTRSINGERQITAQLYSAITLPSGDLVEIFHPHSGDGDWPT